MSLFLKDKYIFHGWALFCHKIPPFSKFMIMSSRSVTSWQELEDPPTCKDNLWIIAWIIRRIIFLRETKNFTWGQSRCQRQPGGDFNEEENFPRFFWNTYIDIVYQTILQRLKNIFWMSTCGNFEGGSRNPYSLPSSGSSIVYASLFNYLYKG